MVSVAERLRPSNSRPVDPAGEASAFHEVADVLGCKWTVAILDAMDRGVNRPGRLLRELPGLSAKVLNQRLRKLQTFGLVVRHAHPEIPPRVEYGFTSRGRSMLDVVRAARRYADWAIATAGDIETR